MVAELSNRLRYEFGVASLVVRMCGLCHDDLWVQVDQRGCCDSWSSQRRNSRDAEHVVVEAHNRVGERPGAADGQVDTRVLGKVDKWNSSWKAWPIWSFVIKAYDVAVDQQVSGAEISTDVVSNVQLGSVQLCVVVFTLCTGRALDCAVSAMYSWSMENVLSCVFPVERCETWCDARSVGNFAGHERYGGPIRMLDASK